MSDIFLDFTGMKLEINCKKKTGKKKAHKHMETKQSMDHWKVKEGEHKTVLRGKFIVIQAHLMIWEKSQIIKMHIKETRRRTSKTES